MNDTKPNPVIDGKLQGTMVCVAVLLSVLLSLEKAVTDIGNERVALAEQRVHRVRAR